MSELSDRLKKLPITLSSIHLGLDSFQDHLDDHWRVTITYNDKSYSTEYRTGIGCRKIASWPYLKREGFQGNKWYSDHTGIIYTKEAAQKNYLKVVNPDVADVLYSLLSDSSNVDQVFDDWCSDLGYDSDSRRALEIYLTCQKTRKGLVDMLGFKLFNELSRLEH